jgi:DeoR family transcriptional regulator, fructose operon transcriptional repressor
MIIFEIFNKEMMLKKERQFEIVRLTNQQGFIRTDKLASMLKVSDVTIRRDIIDLNAKNLVKMEHGGVSATNFLQANQEPEYEKKMQNHALEKKAIGEMAVSFISNGDILIIDSGTTCLQIAQQINISKISKLSVITNDIVIARELNANKDINVILLGGIMRSQYHSTFGSFAEAMISKMRSNKFFFAFDGFSVERGFSSTFLSEIPLKQRMIEISSSVFAVSDSSKIGVEALYTICDVNKINKLITDSKIDQGIRNSISSKGIEVSIAAVDNS